MIILLCICLCPPLLVALLSILGMFFPLGYVCYFFAWFAGLATVLFTLGVLQGFDITDADDWKMLAIALAVPGTLTFLLIKLGDFLGEHHIFEIIEMIF